MLALIVLLPGMLFAKNIEPRDLPARCTVALNSKVGDKPFFGTGSIISPLGYVLTSTTVVPPGATEVNVISPGHFELKGTLLKADEKSELSLVRVEPPKDKPFPFFTIRDSSTAELGEVVMTVANSWQLALSSGELSVSVGFLSGRYNVTRTLAEQPVYLGEVIETTASSNPGSDGGPLLDGSGQLVGVLSLNVCDARWLGIAVPVNVMLNDIEQAIKEDMAKRKVTARVSPLKIATRPGTPIFPKWEARAIMFRNAAKKVAGSVVAIKVDRIQDAPEFTRQPKMPLPKNSHLLSEILKRPNASVTGVIVDPDGWIATSRFNVAGQLRSIKVVLPSGKELDAKLAGWDANRDLALLKVEATGLPAVQFESKTSVGSYACVLGRSPAPENLTLTAGIISAVGRGPHALLQFDAKANVGNTGGPLISLDGKCLGIVGGVTVNSQHGQNSGVAFATAHDALAKTMERLKTGAKIASEVKPSLGITVAEGAEDLKGALVAGVNPGSAAEAGGLHAQDIILKIGDVEVHDYGQVTKLINARKPGEKVKFLIRRGDKEMELVITLGEVK